MSSYYVIYSPMSTGAIFYHEKSSKESEMENFVCILLLKYIVVIYRNINHSLDYVMLNIPAPNIPAVCDHHTALPFESYATRLPSSCITIRMATRLSTPA